VSESRPRYPDGLAQSHERDRPVRRAANWLGLFVLLALLVVAMTGVLGGGPRPVLAAQAPAAELRIKTPDVLRSGMFFEIAVEARARRAIGKPVLAISESYWRDITINTLEPAPASEKSEERMFVFEYDPLAPGDVLLVKFDGQINPSLFGGTAGRIELRDGERTIATIPLEMTVLP
jgi:hypothetical protein